MTEHENVRVLRELCDKLANQTDSGCAYRPTIRILIDIIAVLKGALEFERDEHKRWGAVSQAERVEAALAKADELAEGLSNGS